MNRLQNTNEIEVTIKTFYKEQIIKLDIGLLTDKFGEWEKIVHALAYIYDGEHQAYMKMYEEYKKGNLYNYMLENNHEPFIKVEQYKRGEN
tara:strand:+ start:1296 stop:1568 length:273 start_codon:yes stop_codon:yes gene_type:complete